MIERIVGAGLTDSMKEEFRNSTVGERLYLERIKGKEREKTAEQIELITAAISVVNQIREDFGYEKVVIPIDHIHVMPADTDTMPEYINGGHHDVSGHILVRENQTQTQFLRILIHELIHKVSYQALQVINEDLYAYRTGAEVTSRKSLRRRHLVGLNEALTESLTQEYISKLHVFEHPLLVEESMKTKRILGNGTLEGLPQYVSSSDVYQLAQDEVSGETVAFFYSYPNYRHVVGHLITRIYEQHSHEFASREDVQKVFYDALFSGNLLEIGKLIDKTFGKGTFRRLSEITDDVQSTETFINSLSAHKEDDLIPHVK